MRRMISTLLLTTAATCLALGLIDTSVVRQDLPRTLAAEDTAEAPARTSEEARSLATDFVVGRPERIAQN